MWNKQTLNNIIDADDRKVVICLQCLASCHDLHIADYLISG